MKTPDFPAWPSANRSDGPLSRGHRQQLLLGVLCSILDVLSGFFDLLPDLLDSLVDLFASAFSRAFLPLTAGKRQEQGTDYQRDNECLRKYDQVRHFNLLQLPLGPQREKPSLGRHSHCGIGTMANGDLPTM